MLLAVIPAALWPGDNLWTNDEPRLIANAWHANDTWHPAWGGLWGNFGIRYGPLPTQIYQILLLLTHDPILLAGLRGGLCAGVTAASLLWIARSAGLSPWFAGAVIVAPYVLEFHRLLWDASFTIPLGTFMLGAFAAFLRKETGSKFVATLVSAAFLSTIHPQALPLSVPVIGFLIWKYGPEFRRPRRPLLIALCIFVALNAAFFVELGYIIFQRIGGAVASGYPGGKPAQVAMLAPFLGGKLLSAPLPEWAPMEGLFWVRILSALAYPLCWAGIAIAAGRVCRHWRNAGWPARGVTSPGSAEGVREALAWVCFATVIIQGGLFAATRVPAGPQYFFGTFAAHVFLAWLAVSAMPKAWMRTATTAAYGLGGAWLSFYGAWITHQEGPSVRPSQPKLGSQAALAEKLSGYGSVEAFTDVPHLWHYAQGVRSLRLLLPSGGKEHARLLITDRGRPRGRAIDFEVQELSAGESVPMAAKPVDLAPLPAGWFPPPSN